jgi:hypothetical protein
VSPTAEPTVTRAVAVRLLSCVVDNGRRVSWKSNTATRNVDDFADTGVDAVNPWDSGDFQPKL